MAPSRNAECSRLRGGQRGASKTKWKKREERHYSRIQSCNRDPPVQTEKNDQQPEFRAKINLPSKPERKLRVSLKRFDNPISKASKIIWPSLSVPADTTCKTKECVKKIVAASKEICRQREDARAPVSPSDLSPSCIQRPVDIDVKTPQKNLKRQKVPKHFTANLPNLTAWIRTTKNRPRHEHNAPTKLPKTVNEPRTTPAIKKTKDAATSPIQEGVYLSSAENTTKTYVLSIDCILERQRTYRQAAVFLAEALVHPSSCLAKARAMLQIKNELLELLNKVPVSPSMAEVESSDESSPSLYLTARQNPPESTFVLDCMKRSPDLKRRDFSQSSENFTFGSVSPEKVRDTPLGDTGWFDEMLPTSPDSTSGSQHGSTQSPWKVSGFTRLMSPSPRESTPPDFLYGKPYRF